MANTLTDLKALLGIDSNDTESISQLEIYLRIAERKFLNRLYPFGSDNEILPKKY